MHRLNSTEYIATIFELSAHLDADAEQRLGVGAPTCERQRGAQGLRPQQQRRIMRARSLATATRRARRRRPRYPAPTGVARPRERTRAMRRGGARASFDRRVGHPMLRAARARGQREAPQPCRKPGLYLCGARGNAKRAIALHAAVRLAVVHPSDGKRELRIAK
jgi:hypothetical protein